MLNLSQVPPLCGVLLPRTKLAADQLPPSDVPPPASPTSVTAGSDSGLRTGAAPPGGYSTTCSSRGKPRVSSRTKGAGPTSEPGQGQRGYQGQSQSWCWGRGVVQGQARGRKGVENRGYFILHLSSFLTLNHRIQSKRPTWLRSSQSGNPSLPCAATKAACTRHP